MNEKGNYLVSMLTLSNQDRELQKEALLSALRTLRKPDPCILVPTATKAERDKLESEKKVLHTLAPGAI